MLVKPEVHIYFVDTDLPVDIKIPNMATTQRSTLRVNLSMAKDRYTLLEHIAEAEDREVTYLANWFVDWAMQQYCNLGLTLAEMKNLHYFNESEIQKIKSKIRLKLREAAETKFREVAANNHVPETYERVRKQA